MRKLDGGLSTALEERGLNLSSSLWTGELLVSAPNEIMQAHRAFVDAGAEIIITSAYQLSYSGCATRGWSQSQTSDALTLSTQLAREATTGTATKVAASVGPYGASLADGSEYRGNNGVSKGALREFHKGRLETLIASAPDYLALETMPDIEEVEILIELIEKSETTIPFWVSYSCQDGSLTNAGQSFQQAVDAVQSANGVIAVGANCTAPRLITDLLKSAISSLPYIVYPNAGRTWDAQAKQWSGGADKTLTPEVISEWASLGAQIIGGCCGISPKEIGEMKLP